jgi:hypothetical protein
VLLLQDSLTDEGTPTQDFAAMRALIERSLKIADS